MLRILLRNVWRARLQSLRVSISTDDRQTNWLHCSEKSATFSSEEEATSLNNVMFKNIICSHGNVSDLV